MVLWCVGEDVKCVLTKTKAGCHVRGGCGGVSGYRNMNATLDSDLRIYIICLDNKPETKSPHVGEDVVLWCVGEDVRCVLTKTKSGCLLPCKGRIWWCIWRWKYGIHIINAPLNSGV